MSENRSLPVSFFFFHWHSVFKIIHKTGRRYTFFTQNLPIRPYYFHIFFHLNKRHQNISNPACFRAAKLHEAYDTKMKKMLHSCDNGRERKMTRPRSGFS